MMPPTASYFDPTSGYINIHPPANTQPRNPLQNQDYDPAETEAGSALSSSSLSRDSAAQANHDFKEKESLVRKLLRTDQRDFLSGSQTIHVQAVHLLNALRAAPPGVAKKDKKRVKTLIESYLTRLSFNGNFPFKLDGRANLLLLAIQFHYGLNVYADLAFMPSVEYLHTFRAALAAVNKQWDQESTQDPNVRRSLPMLDSPFNIKDVIWHVIVFYPAAFPSRQGLDLLPPDKRTLRPAGRPAPPPEEPTDWRKYYVHSSEGVDFIADTQVAPPTPLELKFESIRAPEDELSLFCMLVVAAAKFDAYVKSPNYKSPKMMEMHAVLQLVLSAIFHRPSNFEDKGYETLVTIFSAAAAAAKRKPTLKFSSGEAPHHDRMDIDRIVTPTTPTPTTSTPAHHDDPPGTTFDHDVSGITSLLPVPPPPEPELTGGLTMSEYGQLFQNVDSSDARTRVESSMQLLWGAHGCPLHRPRMLVNPLDMAEFNPTDTDSEEEGEEEEEKEEEEAVTTQNHHYKSRSIESEHLKSYANVSEGIKYEKVARNPSFELQNEDGE
ncbi:hypothetical protein C8R45DRAFT_1169143 [Mycena sanguinolenta]|nr:hypothetical protein C8R45DRAFT_1169143 [Mycena sanguinolenta]